MKGLRTVLLLFALPAIALALAPGGRDYGVLDREAVAAGQFWRLWSGHWVHFSASHLFWNLAVLVIAGTWLERVHPGRLWRHAAVAAPLIGLAVLAFEPGLHVYGGLSGLATGVVTLLALHHLGAPGPTRLPWIGALGLVAAKAIHDAVFPAAWFAHYEAAGVRTSSAAHAAGLAAALLQAGVGRLAECRRAKPPCKKSPPGPVTGSRRQGSGCYP